MRSLSLLLLAKLGILAAILVSTALLVDQLGVAPAYCQAASGCALARRAASAWLGPVPLPLLAILAFTSQLALSHASEHRLGQRWLLGSALLGVTVGCSLLWVQARILGAFCPWCVAVDLLAIVNGGLIALWYLQVKRGEKPHDGFGFPLTVAYGVLAVLVPLTWPHFRPASPAPAPLLADLEPGTTTIVEFVDLECPHCRALYPTLQSLQNELGATVTWKRIHVPAVGHLAARDAAILIHCLEPSPLRQALESELFLAPFVSPDSVTQVALKVGVTRAQVARCTSDPTLRQKLERDARLLASLGSVGLPLTFVEGERIIGNQPMSVYRGAIARVRRSPGQSRLQVAAFLAILALLVGSVHVIGSSRNLRRD